MFHPQEPHEQWLSAEFPILATPHVEVKALPQLWDPESLI